jgi:prevent-host-death family protein
MSAPTRKPSNGRKVRRISSTELSKHLASVLTRVRDKNETVIVERNGKPLCQVVPIDERDKFTVADLAKLLASLPPAGKEWADAVAEHIANQETFKAPKWSR